MTTDRRFFESDAAEHFSKSRNTLRSWIKNRKLHTRKQSSSPNAAVLINRAELIQLLGETHQVSPNTIPDTVSGTPTSTPNPPSSQPTPDGDKERLIKALTEERDRWITEVQRLHSELKEERSRTKVAEDRLEQERSKNFHIQDRLMALEREVYALGGSGKGILGYLGAKLKNVFAK